MRAVPIGQLTHVTFEPAIPTTVVGAIRGRGVRHGQRSLTVPDRTLQATVACVWRQLARTSNGDDNLARPGSVQIMEEELAALRDEVARLRAETTRLNALLRLSPAEAGPPDPAQAGGLDSPNGLISATSAPSAKVDFFAELFSARRDAYAVRWESVRTGRSGWMPAVAGGWRRGMSARSVDYLPLTAEIVAAHLTGEIHLGLYPLLRNETCQWLAADFDGNDSMLDALALLKVARAHRIPTALEVSRSGVGAHVWTFFTSPVPARSARQMGFGLLREAMGIRSRMNLSSYDRLFPSQDVLPEGGFGNLIAAPRAVPPFGNNGGDDGAARRSVGLPVDLGSHDPT